VPFFQTALDKANSIANTPYQQYQGPRIADFSDDQYNGFDMVRRQAAQGQPLNTAANKYITNQLNGTNAYKGGTNPYAGPNKYLDQQISAAQSDVVNNYNKSTVPSLFAQFNAGGAYGGTAHQEAAADS
jgi:hypothetical protein